ELRRKSRATWMTSGSIAHPSDHHGAAHHGSRGSYEPRRAPPQPPHQSTRAARARCAVEPCGDLSSPASRAPRGESPSKSVYTKMVHTRQGTTEISAEPRQADTVARPWARRTDSTLCVFTP